MSVMAMECLQCTERYEMARQESGQNGQLAQKEETMDWEKQGKTGIKK